MSKLDVDAVRATQRLIARGFEAYLVGGCVRDLLLDRKPKDYDIATEARPPQVKRTFPRNCRIIGRRFKLAHLHFHENTKILEVSTFRRTPQLENNHDEDDLLITRDNEFGTAEEDAMRRDFTVNALFLDPTRNCILDYTNGLTDLRDRVIRTIGEPRVRFREDPVRILRAAKFAGRLGFSIEPETFAAMAETSGDLVRAAPPRLLEEILRLLRGGHALDSFQLLRDVGALRPLVPVLADFLQQARHEQRVAFWRLLDALDERVQGGRVPPAAVLLGVLLVCPVLASVENNPGRSASSVAEELLGPLSTSLRLPRRDAGCLKRICGVQHRFTQTDETKRFRVQGFVHGPYFDEALELFELRMLAAGEPMHDVDRWRELAGGEAHIDREPVEDRARDSTEADAGAEAEGPDADEGARAPDDAEDTNGETRVADEDPSLRPPFAESEDADGPGRRRRRRRRRGRRRGRRDDAELDATGSQPAASADETAIDGEETVDEGGEPPEAGRAQQPDSSEDEGPYAGPTDGDVEQQATEAAVHEAPVAGEEGGRRRRRRRRRRRGRDAGRDERFPASEQPAPHGDAVDREHRHHEPPHDTELPRAHGDAAAPVEDDLAGDDADVEPTETAAAAEGAPAGADSAADGERSGRRRRRRRGRGRGRHREGQEGNGGEQAAAQRPQAPHGQHGQQQKPQHHPQHQQHQQRGHDRQDRHERRERRRGRGGHGGHGGGPRDVDVVPRYRDRRGKVDVIEPAPLDLSAFDVELDPKRVPTFGSIVEGKGRPKKRSPRVPDDGVDDYKPPPPPGSDGGPAPPPPPSHDTPDTFGDW